MRYENTQGTRHLGIGGASILEMPPILAYQYGIDDTSENIYALIKINYFAYFPR